jgi:hypothetical protein
MILPSDNCQRPEQTLVRALRFAEWHDYLLISSGSYLSEN